MRKLVFCFIVTVFSVSLLATFSVAQERTPEQREKDMIIANIMALRNKEARVAVLQQLLNEELNNLRQMEAVFCDGYNLDLEKFRTGQYQYDEKQGKFIEKKAVTTE